jgi:hypothetical protein
MLKSNTTYTNNLSDLKINIHNIYYESNSYYKVKTTLLNKYNGIVYESNKKYKLYKNLIKGWSEHE